MAVDVVVYTYRQKYREGYAFEDEEVDGVTVTIKDEDDSVLASGTTGTDGTFTATGITPAGDYIKVEVSKTGYLTRTVYAEVIDGTTEYVAIPMYSTSPISSRTAVIRARIVQQNSDGEWVPAEGVQMSVSLANSPVHLLADDGYTHYVSGSSWSAKSDDTGVVEVKVPMDDRPEMRVFRVKISAVGIDTTIAITGSEVDLGTLELG